MCLFFLTLWLITTFKVLPSYDWPQIVFIYISYGLLTIVVVSSNHGAWLFFLLYCFIWCFPLLSQLLLSTFIESQWCSSIALPAFLPQIFPLSKSTILLWLCSLALWSLNFLVHIFLLRKCITNISSLVQAYFLFSRLIYPYIYCSYVNVISVVSGWFNTIKLWFSYWSLLQGFLTTIAAPWVAVMVFMADLIQTCCKSVFFSLLQQILLLQATRYGGYNCHYPNPLCSCSLISEL